MEPITTLLIAASVYASSTGITSRQRPDVTRIERTASHTELMLSTPAPTRLLVAPEVALPVYTSLKDALFEELATYTPDHPLGDPGITSKWEDIALAISFIRALPSGIPLPTLMRGDDGNIGMYWDDDDAYFDLNVDSDGTLSLYSRVRSTDEEIFIDKINIDEVNSAWAFEHFAALTGQYARAA